MRSLRADLAIGSTWFCATATLQLSSYYGWPLLYPRVLKVDAAKAPLIAPMRLAATRSSSVGGGLSIRLGRLDNIVYRVSINYL